MDFQVDTKQVVGEKLRLVERRNANSEVSFDVMAAEGLIAWLDFGRQSELMRIACADGLWRLTKRVPLGWELTIESWEGDVVGWYSGRHWRAGGTMSFIDNAQVDLRRSLLGVWKGRTVDSRDPFVTLRSSRVPGSLGAALRIHALPLGASRTALVALTACAVLTLEKLLPSQPFSTFTP